MQKRTIQQIRQQKSHLEKHKTTSSTEYFSEIFFIKKGNFSLKTEKCGFKKFLRRMENQILL